MKKSKFIAVDFDGTCVTHEFPKVGKDIGAQTVLRRLVENGHKLILFTMRSDKAGISPVTNKEERGGLNDAVKWFEKNDLPLYGVNENPSQVTWTNSPKPYANAYVDDAAVGAPLILNKELCERPFIDWSYVEKHFEEIGYLNTKDLES